MNTRRHVVVLPAFFDRLDELLPSERTADGTPSTADFVLHELTSIVETLAEDYEAVTTPIPGEQSDDDRRAATRQMPLKRLKSAGNRRSA